MINRFNTSSRGLISSRGGGGGVIIGFIFFSTGRWAYKTGRGELAAVYGIEEKLQTLHDDNFF